MRWRLRLRLTRGPGRTRGTLAAVVHGGRGQESSAGDVATTDEAVLDDLASSIPFWTYLRLIPRLQHLVVNNFVIYSHLSSILPKSCFNSPRPSQPPSCNCQQRRRCIPNLKESNLAVCCGRKNTTGA